MALPFSSPLTKKRSHVIAIDLGSRATKAVSIQRKGQGFELLQYTVQETPGFEKSPSAPALAEHLKSVVQVLGSKTKLIALIVGVNDALLRHAEVPMAPIADLRLMLKYNSKNYLQQDLPDYVFDCYVLPPRAGPLLTEHAKNPKCRVLVGGAKKQFMELLQEATKQAGLIADHITPGLIGTANAFELAYPDVFANEIVALVDIGFKSTTINILLKGEFTLSRVVAIGGDKLTHGMAELLTLNYADAEKLKLGMSDEAQPALMSVLTPLGRELRASIDFFEKQEDKTVGHVFISGASARSQFIVETLQNEIMVPCKTWNPVSFLTLALPPQQMGELEQVAPLLAVAAGGAMAAF